VNCGAIPENLMESEFFGYRKGAFTGADSERDGFFQAAQGGTLFLDEVADLPLVMQVKLLRAIQEKKVRKVGSTVEESSTCASSRRPISCSRTAWMPGLSPGSLLPRERHRTQDAAATRTHEDVRALVEALLVRASAEREPPRLEPQALRAGSLQLSRQCAGTRKHPRTGYRAVQRQCGGSRRSATGAGLGGTDSQGREGETLDDYLNRIEKQAILEALAKTAFNRTAAARLLGVSFRSLRYRIERLGIEE
jgi:two-component system response regulator PilR (NtrC family)